MIKDSNYNNEQDKEKISKYNINGSVNLHSHERKGLHQTVKEKNLKVQTNFLRSQTIRDVSAGAVFQGRNNFQEMTQSAYLNGRENGPASASMTSRVTSSSRSNKQMIELSKKYQFNMKELEVLKKRFDAISKKGVLTLQDFKNSLGVMGRDNTLIDRIFALMDENRIGYVLFEDYLRYLTVLLNGTKTEKAMLSFRILSNGKDIITFEDIYHLVSQVSYLWTNMTSTNCIPTQEYLQNIFAIFDYDKDGEVSFDDYFNIYTLETEIFAWFEFLNQSNPLQLIQLRSSLSLFK